MIPKVLHFCRYNSYHSDITRQCYASWERYLSDFEFVEWNESNVPAGDYPEAAFNQGYWSFLSDWVRLHSLLTIGGLYLDLDMEMLRELPDDFFEAGAACCYEFPGKKWGSAFMAAEPGHYFIQIQQGLLYDEFVSTGSVALSLPVVIWDRLQAMGFTKATEDEFPGVRFYPRNFWYPPHRRNKDGSFVWPKKAYAAHHFEGSWKPHANKLAKQEGREVFI